MKKIFICIFIFLICGTYLLLNTQRPVHIAYILDNKYFPYMMVSLSSAIKNKQENTVYHIHIIAKDFAQSDINMLQSLTDKKIKIKIYPAKEKKIDISHLGRYASFGFTLQKLFIDEYLKDIDKVLYLDADTLVQADLSKLYRTDMKDNYVSAVKDGLMYQYPEHIVEIGLEWRNFYFNSGVMLLNLKQMRKDNIKRHALIYYNTHQEIFGDQDVFNVVFENKIIPLSYKYNCISTFFEERDARFLSDFYGEYVPDNPQKVYENATILHFAGHKPWTEYFTQMYLKNLWYRYAAETKQRYY